MFCEEKNAVLFTSPKILLIYSLGVCFGCQAKLTKWNTTLLKRLYGYTLKWQKNSIYPGRNILFIAIAEI